MNQLHVISINFCSQSERPRKLQNSTTGFCYLWQTKVNSKQWWWWCSTQTV